MADMNRMLSTGANALHGAAFGCVVAVVTLSPWCFGAWEMWWFWPMAGLLFLGALLAGLGTLLNSAFSSAGDEFADDPRLRCEGRLAALLAASLPFLAYAFWRANQPSAPSYPLVEMETERSLLLFSTPFVLVLTLFLTATRQRVRAIAAIVLTNAIVLATYAALNHWQNADAYVLWVRTPFHYGARAGGTFFCPNHLAAYLNIALCLIGAILLTRGTRGVTRAVLTVLVVPVLTAWFLTLSRGGTASLVLCLPVALLAGLRGYPWKLRLLATLAILLLVGGLVWTALTVPNPLLERLRNSAIVETVLKTPRTGWAPVRKAFFTSFDRGIYIGSALRAWRTNPTWGIGPGQHAIRWPQFAASDDGDRATGKWPSRTNHNYYLYEVHSDWTQLLEEYGTVGLALFLLPFMAVFGALLRAQGATLRRAGSGDANLEPLERALPLAAILALTVFAIHSTGDFSLQIPAITWSLASVAGCGLLAALPTKSDASETHHRRRSERTSPSPTE